MNRPRSTGRLLAAALFGAVLIGAGLIGAGLASSAAGQQLSIDGGLRVADLWCFPLVDDPLVWHYLPAESRLAADAEGLPLFSLLRYAVTRKAGDEASSIQRAGGGAILHFVVLYDTQPEQVAEAQAALRERLNDDAVVIRGPVVFREGRYALVSSILDSGTGEQETRLLTTGRAPVLAGNRIALSFDLDPEASSVLLESLQTATPDVSLVFDMTFAGWSQAYDAQMTVDWSQVHESMAMRAGGSVVLISVEVEQQIDRLIRDHSIRLVSRGADATQEALIAKVYDKVLELLFAKVEPEQVPKEHRGGLLAGLAKLTNSGKGPASSAEPRFGVYAGYRYKNLRSEGVSVLDFNHRSEIERNHFISFNIGDLYQRYGDDERFFRERLIDDPTFDQRVVHLAIDGALLPELERMINSVTVSLRKRHEDGVETLREVVIDRDLLTRFDGGGDELAMIYGWSHDHDRSQWLRYEYRTLWSFEGGGQLRTEWTAAEAAMIDLFVPYQRRTVQIVDAGAPLRELGVRAVVVGVSYPFFGSTRREQLVVRTDRPVEEPRIEITLPQGQFEYDFDITWMRVDGSSARRQGRDGSGLVFLDEPPAVDDSPAGNETAEAVGGR